MLKVAADMQAAAHSDPDLETLAEEWMKTVGDGVAGRLGERDGQERFGLHGAPDRVGGLGVAGPRPSGDAVVDVPGDHAADAFLLIFHDPGYGFPRRDKGCIEF